MITIFDKNNKNTKNKKKINSSIIKQLKKIKTKKLINIKKNPGKYIKFCADQRNKYGTNIIKKINQQYLYNKNKLSVREKEALANTPFYYGRALKKLPIIKEKLPILFFYWYKQYKNNYKLLESTENGYFIMDGTDKEKTQLGDITNIGLKTKQINKTLLIANKPNSSLIKCQNQIDTWVRETVFIFTNNKCNVEWLLIVKNNKIKSKIENYLDEKTKLVNEAAQILKENCSLTTQVLTSTDIMDILKKINEDTDSLNLFADLIFGVEKNANIAIVFDTIMKTRLEEEE